MHLNSLISGEKSLASYRILVIGGGFSWGDDHGAGVIMAMRLKHRLQDQISAFVDGGGIVIGICNGFQVLVNLGLLPGFERGLMKREVALIANDCGGFRDQWVNLSVNPESHCVFSRDITGIELPIRQPVLMASACGTRNVRARPRSRSGSSARSLACGRCQSNATSATLRM